MTRLSDEAWRAKMEGKSFRQPEPLPLFDAPPPIAEPAPGQLPKAPAGNSPRPPIVAIVCSRGRGGGCRRVEIPNDEAGDPWAKAREQKKTGGAT